MSQLTILQDDDDCEYNHDTPFGWGKYKGVKMRDIPPQYLLDLYYKKQIAGDLNKYVHKNLQLIKNNFKV